MGTPTLSVLPQPCSSATIATSKHLNMLNTSAKQTLLLFAAICMISAFTSEFPASDMSDSFEYAAENIPADAFEADVPKDTRIAEETFVEAVKKAAPRSRGIKVLNNIRALKAYCISAVDKAKDLKDDHPSMSKSALVDLVTHFGKPIKKKKAKISPPDISLGHLRHLPKIKKHKIDASGDIVVQYAKVMGHLRAKYKRGLG